MRNPEWRPQHSSHSWSGSLSSSNATHETQQEQHVEVEAIFAPADAQAGKAEECLQEHSHLVAFVQIKGLMHNQGICDISSPSLGKPGHWRDNLLNICHQM